jgi:hypothetical protein
MLNRLKFIFKVHSIRSYEQIGYNSYERYLIIRWAPFFGAEKVFDFGRE